MPVYQVQSESGEYELDAPDAQAAKASISTLEEFSKKARYYMGPHAWQAVQNTGKGIQGLLEFLSPAGDIVDMVKSSRDLSNATKEARFKDALISAMTLGAATLGVAIPGPPASAIKKGANKVLKSAPDVTGGLPITQHLRPAIMGDDGKVISMVDHTDFSIEKFVPGKKLADIPEEQLGFVTDTGTFLNRVEAKRYAIEKELVDPWSIDNIHGYNKSPLEDMELEAPYSYEEFKDIIDDGMQFIPEKSRRAFRELDEAINPKPVVAPSSSVTDEMVKGAVGKVPDDPPMSKYLGNNRFLEDHSSEYGLKELNKVLYEPSKVYHDKVLELDALGEINSQAANFFEPRSYAMQKSNDLMRAVQEQAIKHKTDNFMALSKDTGEVVGKFDLKKIPIDYTDNLAELVDADPKVLRELAEGRAQTIWPSRNQIRTFSDEEIFTNSKVLEGDLLEKFEHKALGTTGDLPMDQASRMARAKELGFDTDEVWYTGSGASDIAHFDPKHESIYSSSFSPSEEATFLTPDPDLAEHFAGPRGTVYPVFARRTNERVSTATRYDPHVFASDIRVGEEAGNTTVLFKNINERTATMDGTPIPASDQLAVIEPSNIRSVFAKFDPKRKASTNILAGVAGAGLAIPVAGNALMRYQDETEEE